jgi:eukaryotic-like serine/threonine-protein kinase
MTFPLISPEYIVIRHIDSGGQADVYEVRHVQGGRFAARVLREAWDPLARADFQKCIERQVRAAGPRVVPVLAYNVEAPRPFMVLEYMPQGSLADEIRRRANGFAIAEALSISSSLAAALADAHAKSLVHGDFKPGNVLRNAAGVWVLSDFGSAVTVGSRELLRAQRWVGTPAYAAPEQLRGTTCHGSDVYALGIVLHELLTGSTKPASSGLADIVARHGFAAVGLPELVARLTADDPRFRPTAREAVALLVAAWNQAVGQHISMPTGVSGLSINSGGASSRGPVVPTGTDTPGWLKALGWAATAAATVGIANRATKTWDSSLGQYRGSDGKFRGGGPFD